MTAWRSQDGYGPQLGDFSSDEQADGYESFVEAGDDVMQRGFLDTPTTLLAVLDDGDFVSFSSDCGGDCSVVVERHGLSSWFALDEDVFGSDFPRTIKGRFAAHLGIHCWFQQAGVEPQERLVWVIGCNDKLYLLDLDTGCPL